MTMSIHIFSMFEVALKYMCLYGAIPDSYEPVKKKFQFMGVSYQLAAFKDICRIRYSCRISLPLKTVSQHEQEQYRLSTTLE